MENIKCVDCSKEFFFSGKDKQFYERMNFAPPKRCHACRTIRKNGKADGTAKTIQPLNFSVCGICGSHDNVVKGTGMCDECLYGK